MTIGTTARPLRVAIIGSGPSGFYAAEALQRAELVCQVDMYDRLPTPFGLVRGGVAPDHDKIKSVTRVYDKTADHPDFRFYGNVEFGRHLDHDDLRELYHAVIYATGARRARRLGIPGEDLPGSQPAPAFVGWYNGHPDFSRREFDLSCERAVVVGNGNVAVDVARILARDTGELGRTDIAAHALEALRASRVREVVMLGRRGPAQAAFTPKELKELGELSGVDVIVDPAALDLDEVSAAHLEASDDGQARKILALLEEFAARPRTGGRSIELRFLTSPVEIVGDGRVEEVRVEANRLVAGPDGVPRTQGTGEVSSIPCGLVLTAVGYLGAALPGVPFDSRRGVVPNAGGRVLDHTGEPVPGEYAVGWIKRGPTGIIGTNKPDAVESVEALLADAAAGVLTDPPSPDRQSAEARLRYLRPEHTTYGDWQLIDALEQARGAAGGRGREKFTRISEMLDALATAKQDGREHAAD